jgi:hypothetical protein
LIAHDQRKQSPRRDSNPRPSDYESVPSLPTGPAQDHRGCSGAGAISSSAVLCRRVAATGLPGRLPVPCIGVDMLALARRCEHPIAIRRSRPQATLRGLWHWQLEARPEPPDPSPQHGAQWRHLPGAPWHRGCRERPSRSLRRCGRKGRRPGPQPGLSDIASCCQGSLPVSLGHVIPPVMACGPKAAAARRRGLQMQSGLPHRLRRFTVSSNLPHPYHGSEAHRRAIPRLGRSCGTVVRAVMGSVATAAVIGG